MTVLFLLEQQTLQKIDLADSPKGTPEINDIVTIEDNHYKVTGKLYHYLDLFLGIYKWASADLEGLLKHVSEVKGYPKEILRVYLA